MPRQGGAADGRLEAPRRRVGAVANAAKHLQVAVDEAAHAAGGGAHHRRRRRGARCGHGQQSQGRAGPQQPAASAVGQIISRRAIFQCPALYQ